MFTSTVTSPTRSSIKEANDHLQALHERVKDLEGTIVEQNQALVEKDELMHAKIKEIIETKDAEIVQLNKRIEALEFKHKKMEAICREKDLQIAQLIQRSGLLDELIGYAPILDKLICTLRRIPPKYANFNSNSNSKVSHSNPRGPKRSNSRDKDLSKASSHELNEVNSKSQEKIVDGMLPTVADIKLTRSFNITRNFSISDDEKDDEIFA